VYENGEVWRHLALVGLVACAEPGNLAVEVSVQESDGPTLSTGDLSTARSVAVAVEEVAVFSGGVWYAVGRPQVLDLARARDSALLVGRADVPPGSVDGVRVRVAAASARDESGTPCAVEVDAAMLDPGVALDCVNEPVTVSKDGVTLVRLVWHLRASPRLPEPGCVYRLVPVIKLEHE